MTVPLLDRFAQILASARPSIDFPPWDSPWERDRDHWREIVKALLASEEWRAREAVIVALDICESSRGAFSTAEPHDGRCPIARAANASEWRGEWRCVCGREALDAALARLDADRNSTC